MGTEIILLCIVGLTLGACVIAEAVVVGGLEKKVEVLEKKLKRVMKKVKK